MTFHGPQTTGALNPAELDNAELHNTEPDNAGLDNAGLDNTGRAPSASDLSTPADTSPGPGARWAVVPPTPRRPDLRTRLSRPCDGAVAVHVLGDVDTATAHRLQDLLRHRLASTARAVVLDLSAVDFLGVRGLTVIAHARHRAAVRGKTLAVTGTSPCVLRAFRAAGWSDELPTHPDVEHAVASLSLAR